MKILVSALAILTVSSVLSVQAAPPRPWLAVTEGSGFASRASCTKAALRTLKKQKFARMSGKNGTIMGAYAGGSDYQFKVAIKCLRNGSAVVTVVTTLNGQGMKKANSIIAGMRGSSSVKRRGGSTGAEANDDGRSYADDVDEGYVEGEGSGDSEENMPEEEPLDEAAEPLEEEGPVPE